jgi:hypothetical protein
MNDERAPMSGRLGWSSLISLDGKATTAGCCLDSSVRRSCFYSVASTADAMAPICSMSIVLALHFGSTIGEIVIK